MLYLNNMTKKKIENLLKKSSKILFKKLPQKIRVEYSPKKEYGDYSTNLPLELAKEIKQDPLKIAQNILSQILKQKLNMFEKAEVKKPGFINFFLKESYLQKQVREIIKKEENFGKLNLGKGGKANVEFISANPTGLLHIGNGRGAFFGDTLATILETVGYKVTREYYINDAKVSIQIQELGKTALGKGTAYLTPSLKSLLQKLRPHLKTLKSESEAGYFLAQNIQANIQNFIKEKLKINFDRWSSEQNLYREDKVKKVFDYFSKKNLLYKKEGAWWLKTSEFGDTKDEVLIRKTGEPTYFLSDIAYHQDKIQRGYGKIIDIWGADHQGHIKRMQAAMEMLGYKGGFVVLICQMVRLKSGKKLSKRKGEIIELNDLIKEVGLDVSRFFYLSKSLSSQMEFDLDLAKTEGEKNPVFYIQYAYVRAESILKKAKKLNFELPSYNLLKHPLELVLIRELIKLPEIIEDTSKDYQLQRLPEYGRTLASAFHQFYRDCQVLNQDKKLSQNRLALVFATKIVLKNLLSLMGISSPKRM